MTQVERDLIERAYRFADKSHEGQKRASGEAYITHCVSVAAILAELRVPTNIIVAGLLHDTVEDTDITIEDIRREFSDEIARLVDGVTKLTQLPRVSRADQHVSEIEEYGLVHSEQTDDSRKRQLAQETLRKTFMAMGEDIRVVLIKLADRLHNMRTLYYMPEANRKRIAQETLDIFAPLANRLGIWQIKWELEDLGFRYTNTAKYNEIHEFLKQQGENRQKQIEEIIERLKQVLDQAKIQTEISGRPKHIYSIYKKMMEKSRSFDALMDLRGVRLIVPTTQDCYAALGIIHTRWRPIPHEFDDYIAAPKDNNYQSLHTAVIYDDGKPLEVQIRTPEMDQNAEFGIASHWRYKEKGGRIDGDYENRVNMLRRLMDWRQDVTDAQEFVDGMKTDVFRDRVYVFTPKGDIVDLPQGSTPIDFAYHVHTDVGHRCRGAKVNSKLVTLDYELKTGDQLEILTAKHGGPSRDWLNINLGLVRTQRARAKIRQWFKWQDREQNLNQGKTILEREMRRLGMDLDPQQMARMFEFKSEEDLFVAIGCGDLPIGKVVNRLSDLEREKSGDDPLLLQAVAPTPSKQLVSAATVSVLGLKGILTTFARCCKPVPGDDIAGYITRGRGVTIHRMDCPNMLRMDERDRLIKVTWGTAPKTYPVPVEIKAYDRKGLMGDISQILSEENINILDVNLKVSHHIANINLVLEVGDIAQLSRVLTRIENLANVTEAHRVKPG
jgi:GTP pyrophosphokinase